MRYAVLRPSFASSDRDRFASIVTMTRKSIWCIFVLTILAFLATIEAFPSNELEGVDDEYTGKATVHEVKAKGKKRRLENAVITDEDAGVELEMLNDQTNSRNHKHVRAQWRPKNLHMDGRDSWDLISEDGTMEDVLDERYVGRSRRNATVFKLPKRGHKKLKLALGQPGPKGKSRSKPLDGDESFAERTEKKVNRRHAVYSVRDAPGRFRSKRYTVGGDHGDNRADYYAQRRAVMERFYARQKEISEKYARKTTPSPPRYIHRYNPTENENGEAGSASSNDTRVDNAVDTNGSNNHFDTTTQVVSTTEAYKEPMKTTTLADLGNVSSKARTAYNSLEDNDEEGSDDYDYYVLDENKLKSTTGDAGTPTEDDAEVYEEIQDPLSWGICNGRLVYQHNVIITVHNGARADADITTSLQGPFCVSCFKVTPAGMYNATASLIVGNRWYDDSLSSARIKVRSFQDQTLVYAVKVWALPKLHDSCDYA